MKKNWTALTIGLILTAIVFAYTFYWQPIAPKSPECASLETTIAFPVGAPANLTDVQYFPPIGEKILVKLPETYIAGDGFVFYNDSLWTLGFNQTQEIKTTTILRYNFKTQTWKEYTPVGSIDIKKVVLLDLFVSTKKTLWLEAQKYFENTPPFFIRYNEKKDTFEYTSYKNDYMDIQAKKISEEIFSYEWTGYSSDQNGHIWITDRYNLYEFNPDQLLVSPRVQAESGSQFSSPSVDKNGTVWFLDYDKGKVNKYIPKTGALQSFSGKYADGFSREEILQTQNTMLDSKGQLWLSDFGWINTVEKDSGGDPMWYRIVRSPVFIYQPEREDNKYVWSHPRVLQETPDGLIWFETFGSLVKLDVQSGKWCKISSGGYVATDNKAQIWILYLNQIYEYPMKK